VLHFETERFTLTTNFDMETKLDNTNEPQHDAKLPVSGSVPTDSEIQEWAKKEAARWEKDKAKAVTYASRLIDGALWMRSRLVSTDR
jgi:hypothetical protein